MHYHFALLLITGLLIVIASFSFVFSFDYKRTRKNRRILLLTAIGGFVFIAVLIAILMRWPVR